MVCSLVWSPPGVAHHGGANPLDAVLVSTLAAWLFFCVGRLACGPFIVALVFCSSLIGTRLRQPPHGRGVRRGVDCAAARAGVAGGCLGCLPRYFGGLLCPACPMWQFWCERGVPDALCWFAVVVAASGRLVRGCAVARMSLARSVWSL